MSVVRNEKLIMLTIAVSFIIAFLIQILALVIYPPDTTGDFPIYNANWAMWVQVVGAAVVIAMTVLAMKAEEERQILAAAGFTAQAISFGINVLSVFDIAEVVTFAQYEEFYRVTVSTCFLIIPSVVLIGSYDRFRKWVRYIAILTGLPFLVGSLMFLFGVRDYQLLENVLNIGYHLMGIDWLLWGWNVYANYRKEHAKD